MSTITMESNNVSTCISEFIGFLESFDWFEGVCVNTKKMGDIVDITLNLVFDGSKIDNNIFRQCRSLFNQIISGSELNMTLDMMDIDTRDSDSLYAKYW